jgi:hypothetical protein
MEMKNHNQFAWARTLLNCGLTIFTTKKDWEYTILTKDGERNSPKKQTTPL